MCGIIACRTNRPAVDYLRVGLRRLEYRGYDSVGVAMQTASGGIVRLRTTKRIAALEGLLDGWRGSGLEGVGIGHTRWATHGSVTESNAHPHIDCSGRISLVHNGIIENAEDIRAELTAAGHRFDSLVDSEVLCHLIEEERQRCPDLVKAIQNALTRVEGSWALAVLEGGTGRIAVAAHGSPLLVAHNEHGDFAASDVAAIADWVEEYRVLDDGDVLDLELDGSSIRKVSSTARCLWHGSDVELNGYVDYMAKEIDEQPEAAARALDDLGDGIATGAFWDGLGLAPFDRLRVIGCGTSLNAGRIIANVVRGVAGIPAVTTAASEAGTDVADTGQLCLAISQSGETADVLCAVKSSVLGQSPLLALTNNPYSTLARLSDTVVGCSAGPEIGVAATKTFICQVVSGSAVMISALVASGRISAATGRWLVDELKRVPDRLAASVTTAKCLVPPLIEKLTTAPGFMFIARGSGLPYASEGALKLKELTYRWAEHYPAGELKHGPLALIGPDTPVIVIDNGDPKLACNIAEVQARGGRIIVIGPAGCDIPVTTVPVMAWGPLESTVPMQILARNLALALGRDVDKPRNLAKSVTVE